MQCIQRFAKLSTTLGQDNGNSKDRKYELLKEPAIAVAKSRFNSILLDLHFNY